MKRSEDLGKDEELLEDVQNFIFGRDYATTVAKMKRSRPETTEKYDSLMQKVQNFILNDDFLKTFERIVSCSEEMLQEDENMLNSSGNFLLNDDFRETIEKLKCDSKGMLERNARTKRELALVTTKFDDVDLDDGILDLCQEDFSDEQTWLYRVPGDDAESDLEGLMEWLRQDVTEMKDIEMHAKIWEPLFQIQKYAGTHDGKGKCGLCQDS